MSIPDKHLREQYINSDGSRAFTADQSMGSNKITNLAAPTADNDAARKGDVDAAKEGLDPKDSVRVATVAAGTLASDFENGDTIDGVVLATGNRILIKDQAAGIENGIYTVNASGAPTRADDFAAGASVANAYTFAEEGTVNADRAYVCTNNAGSDVVGTDALNFTRFGAGNSVHVDKSLPVGRPSASEDIPWFYVENAVTVSAIRFVLVGATDVTVTIRHDPDRSAVGNEIITGGTVVTNTTTGQNVTSFNDATIPANSHVWFETTARTGSPDFVAVYLFSTED